MKGDFMRGISLTALLLGVAACAQSSSSSDLEKLLAERKEALDADAGVEDAGAPRVEDCSMAGEPCSVGEGQCARVGSYRCEKGTAVCDATPGVPAPELCDNRKDEDCDGDVDEAPEGACCGDDECGSDELCRRDERYAFDPGYCSEQETQDTCGDADLQIDVQNCGACGEACADGKACIAGACVFPDSGMADPCEGVDLDKDELNCGTCGHECGADEECEAGTCQTPCDGADLQIDDDNCGTCGEACEADESCIEGACAPDLPGCGGADLQTDIENCGTCGHECAANESCDAGVCEPPCGGADFMTDELHCGACGESCASGELCAGGYCIRPQVLAAGAEHVCALQPDGELRCWGGDAEIQAAPTGRFVFLASSAYAACAIREADAQTLCWGTHYADALNAPSSPFRAITLAKDGACGIRADNEQLQCWGDWPVGVRPPSGFVQATDVAGGNNYTCALQTDGVPTCWGFDPSVPAEYIASVPSAAFESITAGTSDVCGVRSSDKQVECWGLHLYTPPATDAEQVSTAGTHACLIRTDNQRALCWGDASDGQLDAPREALRTLVTGGGPSNQGGRGAFTCAVRASDNELVCWGSDANWSSSPPSGSTLSP